jgi:hypothetical protein
VSSPRTALPSTGADPGLAYLDALRRALEEAAKAAGGFVEEEVDVAGLRLRLRFAGERARDVLHPPYEHLAATGSGAPELSIDVLDSASTGVQAAAPPWSPPETGTAARPILRYQSERACVLDEPTMGILSAADPGRGEAILHLRDAAALLHGERAVPLRDCLQLLLGVRDRWLIHAGAAGMEGTGALLVGHSGSGKSTLALSCAMAGMEIVSDDYVVMEPGSPPIAHATQSTAKLTADSAARLRIGPTALEQARFEPTLEGPAKAVVDLRSLFPDLLRHKLRVGALIAPSLSELPRPALEPIPAAQGMRSIAPSTVMQARSRMPGLLAALGALAREVPSYALHLGPDPEANAAEVARVVGRHG